MEFMRAPQPSIDKSHSTLYSMSTNTMVSGGSSNSGSTRTQTTLTSDSNNNVDDEDDGIESLNRSGGECVNIGDVDSESEFSFNECDITLIDDDMCDAKNDGEIMFLQVVEMLRFEEVCSFCFMLILLNILNVNGDN